jgi:Domain of unknown function (DUF4430)
MIVMGDLNTNHKKGTIVTIIVLLVVLASGTVGTLIAINHHTNNQVATTSPQVEGATVIRFTAQKNQTVLAQLEAREKVVVQQDPTYGAFVESIDGVKNGVNNKYWAYYVNGQMANIGAGNYTTKGGEEIVWKFE